MRFDIGNAVLPRYNTNSIKVVDYEMNILKYLQPYDEKLIRFGSDGDGGYLIPEVLLTTGAKLISFGIGGDCNFENDWYEKISKDIVSYDNEKIKIDRETIFDKEAKFNLMHVDKTNIVDIVEKEATTPFYIKMDIEGAEYDILDILLGNENCLGIALEFHGIEMDDIRREQDKFLIEDRIARKEFPIFERLIKTASIKYNIVHVHCNNGPYGFYMKDFIHTKNEIPTNVIEITLLRKDLCTSNIKRQNSLIVGLDAPNDGNRPDINLIF